MDERNIVVVGAGPAGYYAAVRASQLGGKVTLIEGGKLGGICLNWGCIPMQLLIRCAEALRLMKEVEDYGINVGKVDIDFARLLTAKDAVIKTVLARMHDTMKANNIEVIRGWARLVSPSQVEIELGDGSRQIIQAGKLIVAPGSIPKRLSFPGADGSGVITLKDAIELNQIPKSLVIIGGGVIGLELATFWVNLGCAVTIVEIMPQIIPGEDHELASSIENALREDGVQIYTGAEVERIDDIDGAKSVTISGKGEKHKVEAQLVVFAAGQSPVVEGLGLEEIGVAVSKGRIQTNNRMETNVAGVYAAGDATGEVMLASVALVQGRVAAENAMGGNSTIDYQVVPRCIRTFPEVAAVGVTEEGAKERGLDIRVGKFPLAANTKASILKGGSGFIKVIAHSKSGEILGVHIIGPQATEIIAEAALIMKMRGTIQDIVSTLHAHPTVGEAIRGAALNVGS